MTINVVLKDRKTERGTEYLEASITPRGDIKIEGQNLGKQVEGFFGSGLSEYEYVITIQAADVPSPLQLLGSSSDILEALKAHYSPQDALYLKSMLEKNNIRHEFWSRVGD